MKREFRTIIKIDEEACNGCGLCVTACHEGAIALVDGKAKLMHEHYCDGLGDCLPACPTGAITFEQRIAEAYDEAAVIAAQAAATQAPATHTPATQAPATQAPDAQNPAPQTAAAQNPAAQKTADENAAASAPVHRGCPGSMQRTLRPQPQPVVSGANAACCASSPASQLRQWPVQIKLVSPTAPYFDGADLLIAADCTAFAYGAFHQDFMTGKVTLIGCPKLDAVDYTDKLSQILVGNDIASVTVARMEVPCCGGIEHAAKIAVAQSGKDIPIIIETVSTDGRLL